MSSLNRPTCRPAAGVKVAAVAWLVALLAGVVTAQPATPPAEPPTAAAAPADERNESAVAGNAWDPATPRGAARAFIDSARAGDYAAAATHLDLSGIPAGRRATEGPRLARLFKLVLDRELWIDYGKLSDRPEGDVQDRLPQGVDEVGRVGDFGVLLERATDAEGGRVWKFASTTVENIPALYDRYGYGKLGELLPAPMFEVHFLEVRLWQWLGLAILLVASWLVSWLFVAGAIRIARPLVARTASAVDDRILSALPGPLKLLVATGVFALGAAALKLSVPAAATVLGALKVLALLAVVWIGLRLVDVAAEVAREFLLRNDRKAAVGVIPISRRTVKVFLVALALIGALQNMGIHVTGLLAGLGVGGLAVALAAQKSLANLFGGVTLLTDQPVRVGDFCRFGDGKLGTVEEIGLRSTRVRTLDRTLVTVPNSEFSEIQLENFAARDRIRLYAVLGLRYETTPDQLRYVLSELRKLLLAHPRVSDDPARVRFIGFGAHSLDVEVFAFVPTSDWNEFLAVREDLYLRMMDLVQRAGTGFAFPSQTLYLGRDGGLDTDLAREAEQTVRGWRDEGRLPFPDLSPEAIDAVRDSLDYPPRGSVLSSASQDG